MDTNTTVRSNIARYNLKAVALAALIATFIGVFIGLAAGGGNQSKANAAAAPTPTVTVTAAAAVVAPTPAETVTVTEVKTKVPASCSDALDQADRGFVLAADLTSEFKDAIQGIQDQDISAITTATDNITSINSSLNRLSPKYNENKTLCHEAAN